jgi:DNA-binding transcriptional ArsR family regulator
VFITRFANPHTALPDWLILTNKIKPEVQHMATVIIVLSKRGMPPSKDEIAESLGVTPRTIQRWLAELRDAGMLSYQLVGKRRMYVFHDQAIRDSPITDPHGISDRMTITDPAVSDRAIIHEPARAVSIHGTPTSINVRSDEIRISDPSGSGGSSESPTDSELPTTEPRTSTKVLPESIETETGRWLVKIGFNIASAYRFQGLPLKVAQADVARRRDLGQGNGAIINAWKVELPEYDYLSDQPEQAVSDARRAELQAKYGDLFLFSGDPLASDEDTP